jgi:PPOX class probable F420-dependent enzyme
MPILDHTPEPDKREERLRNAVVAWLGTVRPDGRPHLVPVWFHWDGASLTILTSPDTQKVRNLRYDARLTIALDDTAGGRDVVVFEGVATLLTAAAQDVVPEGYLEKYAGLLAEMEWPIAEYLADYRQVIVVEPTRFLVW